MMVDNPVLFSAQMAAEALRVKPRTVASDLRDLYSRVGLAEGRQTKWPRLLEWYRRAQAEEAERTRAAPEQAVLSHVVARQLRFVTVRRGGARSSALAPARASASDGKLRTGSLVVGAFGRVTEQWANPTLAVRDVWDPDNGCSAGLGAPTHALLTSSDELALDLTESIADDEGVPIASPQPIVVPSTDIGVEWRDPRYLTDSVWSRSKRRVVERLVERHAHEVVAEVEILDGSTGVAAYRVRAHVYDAWLARHLPYFRAVEHALSASGLVEDSATSDESLLALVEGVVHTPSFWSELAGDHWSALRHAEIDVDDVHLVALGISARLDRMYDNGCELCRQPDNSLRQVSCVRNWHRICSDCRFDSPELCPACGSEYYAESE